MKLVISILVLLAANSSFAVGQFSGHCVKAAVNAAVQFWADVPKPDPNLEYMPFSAGPVVPGSNIYKVVLAFSYGDEAVYGQYEVIFDNLNTCANPSVKKAN